MTDPTTPALTPVFANKHVMFAGRVRTRGEEIAPELWAAFPVAQRAMLLRQRVVVAAWPPPPHRPLVYESSLDRNARSS